MEKMRSFKSFLQENNQFCSGSSRIKILSNAEIGQMELFFYGNPIDPTAKGVRMLKQNHLSVDEIFIIKTEDVELVGSLMTDTSMEFSSKGTVRFKDGTFWGFQSPPGERHDIRKKVVDLFEKIAAFYDAKIFSHRFERDLSGKGLSGLTHMGRRFWD